MIVFARGSITNREALAQHREEELRAVAQQYEEVYAI
jgi:hypothetical protein